MSTTGADSPTISVVIPIYDREEELRLSIESILSQTFQDFELLLICDGSPPGTLAIVDHFKNHPKVRIFKYNIRSGNAVRGRNKAIREAHGRYLAFQDSDDISEPDRLAVSLRMMEQYKVDVVHGGWRALMDGSRVVDGLRNGDVVIWPDVNYEILKKPSFFVCQSTVMCRLDALRAIGGIKTAMRYLEDYELWLRLAYNGYQFKAIPRVLTNLRLHSKNLQLTFLDGAQFWLDLAYKEHKRITPLEPKIGYVIPNTDPSDITATVHQHVSGLMARGFDVESISREDCTPVDRCAIQSNEIRPSPESSGNYDILVATDMSTAHTVRDMNAKQKFYFVHFDENRFITEALHAHQMTLEPYHSDFLYMTDSLWMHRRLKKMFNCDGLYLTSHESVIDELEQVFFPEKFHCENRVIFLNKKIVALPSPMDRVISQVIDTPSEHTGFLDSLRVEGDIVTLGGWAKDPINEIPAKEVLITNQEMNIVGHGIVSRARLDVATSLQNEEMRISGWWASFNKSLLHRGHHTLHAYSISDNGNRAVRLNGEFHLVT